MSLITLGIDTSNYTTSAAICRGGVITENLKIPLPVSDKAAGLRQSDAVFAHTKNLPRLFDMISGDIRNAAAVGFSAFPRDAEGSYMPCFLCGQSAAAAVSASLGIPKYAFSHQAGHIAAAVYSSKMPEFEEFYAFHISGGTLELLKVSYDGCGYSVEIAGGTKDTTAGQMIDRTGVMLGVGFPCGATLDAYSKENEEKLPKIKVSVDKADCNLSGLQNKTLGFYKEGKSKGFIAAYTFEYIKLTLERMLLYVLGQKALPVLFSGGVASNLMLKAYFSEKYGAYFAAPEFSADNAAGIAILAYKRAVL